MVGAGGCCGMGSHDGGGRGGGRGGHGEWAASEGAGVVGRASLGEEGGL